jgi:hypothetical protein
MAVLKIVIIVFILLVILYLIINAFSKTSNLTKMADGKTLQTISVEKLKNINNSSNFTYSMWLYVDDWNYNYGQEKVVLDRSMSPTVVLGDKPNTLKVKMSYYNAAGPVAPGTPTGNPSPKGPMNAATQAACTACAAGYTCACTQCNNGVKEGGATGTGGDDEAAADKSAAANSKVNTCLIDNVPIQKWFNVIVSLYGLTLDVYLDGKLVRTCIMPGVPQMNNANDIRVTPSGGFSGWTANFQYWADSSNPQQAYNIYKAGFGGSVLGNAVSKYRVQVDLMQGNVKQGGFQI